MDQTGPVLVILRDKVADSFLAQLTEQPKNTSLLVSLTPCRVGEQQKNDWNGTLLTPMGMLQSESMNASRSGTIITFPQTPTSTFLQQTQYAAPDATMCISNFGAFASKFVSPFRATFRGMIVNVMALDYNQAGTPKKKFALVDRNGAWINCWAMHQNAMHNCLTDGYEIVLYFGIGRGNLGSCPPAVYFLKDACILPVTKHLFQWPLRTEVEVQ